MYNCVFRQNEIIKLCVGKTVLDLGFVQHSKDSAYKTTWLHRKISEVAKTIVGIDILADKIDSITESLQTKSIKWDVTKLHELELYETFDVIVCGELIEHIDNPNAMLTGIKKFMNKDSIFIITTPNPWSYIRIKKIKKNNLEKNWLNSEHVCWYSFETLKNLLLRHNFKKVKFDYYFTDSYEEFSRYGKGIVGILRKIRRYFWIRKIPKRMHDGLFFVVKK
ncbi:MAG: class I SAM-dependent methyltransferase [Candidatus Muirbacterium halophilum]|nr:class I SAM-dependent methyltransferase [Candidatus Muirbacterium halophilum]MCK9476616.1 class I SAM-dependent methyltransferase [Candidatus Muirbacterium halophilum]